MIDESGELERLANAGYIDAQYEYGKALFTYGGAFQSYGDRQEGLQWIKKSAQNGYELAEDFLAMFGED
jgi:TPR repeat protein